MCLFPVCLFAVSCTQPSCSFYVTGALSTLQKEQVEARRVPAQQNRVERERKLRTAKRNTELATVTDCCFVDRRR